MPRRIPIFLDTAADSDLGGVRPPALNRGRVKIKKKSKKTGKSRPAEAEPVSIEQNEPSHPFSGQEGVLEIELNQPPCGILDLLTDPNEQTGPFPEGLLDMSSGNGRLEDVAGANHALQGPRDEQPPLQGQHVGGPEPGEGGGLGPVGPVAGSQCDIVMPRFQLEEQQPDTNWEQELGDGEHYPGKENNAVEKRPDADRQVQGSGRKYGSASAEGPGHESGKIVGPQNAVLVRESPPQSGISADRGTEQGGHHLESDNGNSTLAEVTTNLDPELILDALIQNEDAEQHVQRPIRMKDFVRAKKVGESTKAEQQERETAQAERKVEDGDTEVSGAEEIRGSGTKRKRGPADSDRPPTAASSRVPAKILSPDARLERIRNLACELKKAQKVIARLRVAKAGLEAEVLATKELIAEKPLLDKYKAVTRLCSDNELPDVLSLLADALLGGSLPPASIRFQRLVSLAVNCNKDYTNQLQYSDAEMRYFATLRKQSCAAAVLEAMRGPMNVGEGHGKHSLATAKITEFVPSLKAIERYEKQMLKERELAEAVPSMKVAVVEGHEGGFAETGEGGSPEEGFPAGPAPENRLSSDLHFVERLPCDTSQPSVPPFSGSGPSAKPGKRSKAGAKAKKAGKEAKGGRSKEPRGKANKGQGRKEGKGPQTQRDWVEAAGLHQGNEGEQPLQQQQSQSQSQSQSLPRVQLHHQQEQEGLQYEQQQAHGHLQLQSLHSQSDLQLHSQHAQSHSQLQQQQQQEHQMRYEPQVHLPQSHSHVQLHHHHHDQQMQMQQQQQQQQVQYEHPLHQHRPQDSPEQHSQLPQHPQMQPSELEEVGLPQVDLPLRTRPHPHRMHPLGSQMADAMQLQEHYEDARMDPRIHPQDIHQSRALDFISAARWHDTRVPPRGTPGGHALVDSDEPFLRLQQQQQQQRAQLDPMAEYAPAAEEPHEPRGMYREHASPPHHHQRVDPRFQVLRYDRAAHALQDPSTLSLRPQLRPFQHPLDAQMQEQDPSAYLRMHNAMGSMQHYEPLQEEIGALREPYLRPQPRLPLQHYDLGLMRTEPEAMDLRPPLGFAPYMTADHNPYGRYLPAAH